MPPASLQTIIDVSVLLDAPPAEVFALVTDHAQLPTWAPGVHRVTLDTSRAVVAGGPGTVRTLHPRFGAAGDETVLVLEAPSRFVYSASDASLRGLCTTHTTRLSLAPRDDGARTALRWTVEAAPPRSWWRWRLARWMFAGAAWVSCRNLRRRFRATRM